MMPAAIIMALAAEAAQPSINNEYLFFGQSLDLDGLSARVAV